MYGNCPIPALAFSWKQNYLFLPIHYDKKCQRMISAEQKYNNLQCIKVLLFFSCAGQSQKIKKKKKR